VIGVDFLNYGLKNLDLIDLISERHGQLREIAERAWNESNDLHISNSEWYIMSRIYKKKPTLSYVSKHVDISRQATHKFVKSLEQKGLIEISNSTQNKKVKCLELTTFGEECYEKNNSLKEALERKIAAAIGTDNFNILKDILKSDWGLNDSQ